MSESLNISLHGTQRVEIIERLVHICRYSPGLVFLDGEPGKSPVNFLRHMADLLRDELDFALLDAAHSQLGQICDALMAQWFVYRADGDGQTDAQRIHHFLDVGAQGGRMTLVVVERTQVLDDDSLNFLIGLMARHARLTVLFAGVVDTRPLLRRAQQAEVPVHRIELPEIHSGASASSGVSQRQSDSSGEMFSGGQNKLHGVRESDRSAFAHSDVMMGTVGRKQAPSFLMEDLFIGDDSSSGLSATRRKEGARQRFVGERTHAMSRTARLEPTLGVSVRLADIHDWGVATLAGLRRRRWRAPVLIVAVAFLGALLLLAALYYPVQQSESVPSVIAVDSVPVVSADTRSVAGRVEAVGVALNASAPPLILEGAGNVGNAGNAARQMVSADVRAEKSEPAAETTAAQQVSAGQSSGVGAPSQQLVSADPAVVGGGYAAPKMVAEGAEVIQPVKKPEANAAAKKPEKKVIAMTERQWREHPEYFTVQLAAAYGESSIKALAARLPAGQPHLIYRGSREGRPWFVLLYGSFSNRDAAVAVKDQLSKSLKGQVSPWVRKQGEVIGH